MKFSVKLISTFYLSLVCASVSTSALAIDTQKPERWFEIEVILFKQLGDKSVLKEQFPNLVNASNLPKYNNNFDLLTSYLQPNLTGIKQFMPLCNAKNASNDPIDLHLLVEEPFLDIPSIDEAFGDSYLVGVSGKHSETSATLKPLYDLQDKLTSPLFSTQHICIITREDVEPLLSDEQLANFTLDGFDVEALPSKLNAVGIHTHSEPYLIADESLLLSDITQRLQWSKEFKPLLHFGWRQVGVTQNKAIPLKLFAGEHLDYNYQQASDSYQSSLDESKEVNALTFKQETDVTLEKSNLELARVESINPDEGELIHQKLTQLFNELDNHNDHTVDQLITELKLHTVEALVEGNNDNSIQKTQLLESKAPIKPLQPWFLDGFIKIHLDHYLYITADFNVVNHSIDKNKNNMAGDETNNNNMQLINFSQNKRAITGEIHYFDHPYIGMIVQIRRFDPTKPKDEAVTQVIN